MYEAPPCQNSWNPDGGKEKIPMKYSEERKEAILMQLMLEITITANAFAELTLMDFDVRA